VKQLARILVGVDYSEPARAAFDRAVALSSVQGAALTVVHAVPTDQSFGSRASERIELTAKLRRLAERSRVALDISVQHGDPAGVILLHALARRPDLIVVGTHRRTGLDRVRAGSVAGRLLQQASQPVLAVPRQAPAPPQPRGYVGNTPARGRRWMRSSRPANRLSACLARAAAVVTL
jgi:nucleotide-binding universal stress UspA family protein